jgi:hypothetical protein
MMTMTTDTDDHDDIYIHRPPTHDTYNWDHSCPQHHYYSVLLPSLVFHQQGTYDRTISFLSSVHKNYICGRPNHAVLINA